MSFKKYSIVLFAGIGLLSLAVVLFNLIADPYEVWGISGRVGINRYAMKGENLERLNKPIRLAEVKPQVLLLGASKTNFALDAAYFEQLTGKTTYNMGINAARIYELRRYMEHAAAVDPALQEVVLEVDFSMFLDGRFNQEHPTMAGFDEEQIGHRYMTWNNFCKTTFSFTALQDSVENLRANHRERYNFPAHEQDGRISDGCMELTYGRAGFFQDVRQYMGYDGFFRNAQVSRQYMEELKRIVRICEQKHIALHIVIAPVNAALLSGIGTTSWDVYEAWLREMSAVPGVIDFTSYNWMTEEEAEGERQYYWDAFHMKKNVGKLLLERIAGRELPAELADFGCALTQDTVGHQLERLRAGRLAWEGRHPEILQQMAYYNGFIRLKPYMLSELQPAESLFVHLDEISGHAWQRSQVIAMQKKELLRVKGWRLNKLSGKPYMMLKAADGTEYFTSLENAARMDVAEMFQDSSQKEAGFQAGAALDLLPEGTYTLYFLEQKGEKGYVSSPLAVLQLHL